MKKLFVLFCLLTAIVTFGQAPQYLNYQGVARDASGNIISSPIGIKFEIIQGSPGGTVVYEETNNLTPSSAGIFTAAIGNGIPVSGTFSLTNWAGGPYFIRVSMDPAGGTSYSAMGTSQLLSVPYALYAEKAGNTQTVNITGPNVTGTYPNYTITAPAALIAGTGISITGNTITNTAPNPTIIPSGITSITGTHPTFTVDVPPPSLGYNSLTNVLSLTQGTAITTTTLVGSGSNTVSMFATGIASVTPVGAGSNFTVSVHSPSFTGVGSTTVSGTYPNYVIATPGAATATPTSLQINAPHSTSTLSPNNFSINIAPTTINGPGVIGAYPNYTITASPSTSIFPGGSNVIVNGSSPLYTISASTPTIQINAPNAVTPLGLNNYSINVPPTNLTGAGVASVSGTYPNYSITVPSPTISSSGNTITISQGTAVATATFAAGPWATTSGVLHPAASPTNDKVAIGQNSATSMLEVALNAGGTNTLNPVATIANLSSSFGGAAVLHVRNTNGATTGIIMDQASQGDGIAVNLTNTGNGSNALQVNHSGTGNVGFFSLNNATSTGRVIDAATSGLGTVLSAVNTNSLSTAATIYGNTNGSNAMYLNNTNPTGSGASVNSIGTAVYGSNSGPFHTFQAQNTNATPGIYAGYFSGGINAIGKTSGSSSYSFRAQNSSLNDVLTARDDGNVGVGTGAPNGKLDIQASATFTGYVVNINNPNSANGNPALYLSTAGSGGGIYVANSNLTSNAGNFYNTNAGSTAAALAVQNNGSGNGLDVFNVGGGRAISASNNATLTTAFFNNAGNGYAVYGQNPSASTSRAANFIGGVDIMGKTSGAGTFPLVITNVGSTNIFNVRDDGHVGIGYANPAYKLAVSESTNALSAIYANNSYNSSSSPGVNGVTGLTQNTHSLSAGVSGQATAGNAAGVLGESTSVGPSIFGTKNSAGNAGLFSNNASGNASDALMVSTNGTGASIHTKNVTSAGANNLGLLIEDGHIGSLAASIPTSSVGVSCTACTGASLSTYANDVAGAFNITMTASFGATFDYTVTYTKPYRKNPVVVVTPANLVGGNVGKYYVTNNGGPGNYTGFTVTFIGGISGGAGVAKFNYMVIEASN